MPTDIGPSSPVAADSAGHRPHQLRTDAAASRTSGAIPQTTNSSASS